MCQSTRRFFKFVQILSNFVFRVFEGKEKKGGFWKEKTTSFTRPICARARARERKRERKKEREREKERGRGEKRREDDEFGEGIAFPKEKAVFFKKETVRV